MSIFRGEVINQNLPNITVTGSISGSFTVTGTDTPDDLQGDGSSIARVDTDRIVKYDHTLTTIHGIATVTITPAANTIVAYSLSGRNPTSKAVTQTALTQKYRCHQGLLYASAFTIPYSRPGQFNNTVIRIRAWRSLAGQISPNEKSKLLILKFNIDPNS